MNTLLKITLFAFLVSIFSCSSSKNTDKAKEWGPGVEKFLIPLTFPDSEWSAEDFGKQTTQAEKKILQKFLPRIYIAKNSLVPLDFYQEYLPQSVLKGGSKKNVSATSSGKKINRKQLKAVERSAGYFLDYQGEFKKCILPECALKTRSIYGRVFYEDMLPPKKYQSEEKISFTVLKYNLVFAASGLPFKMSWYKNFGTALIGDRENWHELDIHGAIQILVSKKTGIPEVLLLAQHNHFRSYAIGKDILLPKDNRIEICIAIRSNEPYLCAETTKLFRTVGNPNKFEFVLGGKASFFDGGYDLVEAKQTSVMQKLQLKFLPSRDPLYTSWIDLGGKNKILGIFPSFFRSAPPGINMNTTPKLKKYTDIAKVWYFLEKDQQQIKLFNEMGSFFDPNLGPLLEYNGGRLWEALRH